ncbi:hypothetical protein [Cytobacillus oceanisediminis]|uniref:hypothetical protein n=1 Tax=Cytobacillus oceanisediminis TaxID=665099 RepID=UPI001FB4EAFB|nr:hypothetical protein [Cytobacillus oceanisediminis]UOE58033.1 hypothetical protein IRB79_27605 [Cytobacillus oceanisediminis]
MSKEVYIRLRDGDKESEMKVDSINPEHQLALMDGVFKFFNLDVDFKELADIYHRSGKAYKEFYEHMDSESDYHKEIEKEPRRAVAKTASGLTKEKFEAAYKDSAEDEELPDNQEQPKELEEESEPVNGFHSAYDPKNTHYFETGIKFDSLNKPLYKCRYRCPSCNDESNHYIKKGTQHVRCWKCQRMLKVNPATVHGEPDKSKNPEMYRDQFGNFYIAGAFVPDVKTLAEAEMEQESEDDSAIE